MVMRILACAAAGPAVIGPGSVPVRFSGASDPGDQPVNRRNAAAAGSAVARHLGGGRRGRLRKEEVRLGAMVTFPGIVLPLADPAPPFWSARRGVSSLGRRILRLVGGCTCCVFHWSKAEEGRSDCRRGFLVHHQRNPGLEGAKVLLGLFQAVVSGALRMRHGQRARRGSGEPGCGVVAEAESSQCRRAEVDRVELG